MKRNKLVSILALAAAAVLVSLSSRAWAASLVRVIDNDHDAVFERAQAIRNAKREVLISYYAIENDPLTRSALQEVQDAASRGVKVKILIDDMHSDLNQETIVALAEGSPKLKENIELRVFNPFSPFSLLSATYRIHDKMIVVDGEIAIIGGRNLASGYFGQNNDSNANLKFRDVDIVIKGDGAKDPQKYFITLWNQNPMVQAPDQYNFSNPPEGLSCTLQENPNQCEYLRQYNKEHRSLFRNLVKKNRAECELCRPKPKAYDRQAELKSLDIKVDNVDFMVNDPTKEMSQVENKLWRQIFSLIEYSTNQSLTIVSPYGSPSTAELAALERLVAGKPHLKLKLITNSLSSMNSPVVFAAYMLMKPKLVKLGFEIHEYDGPEMLHAKMYLIDENSKNPTSMIGSFNLDVRSAEINREVMVRFSGPGAETISRELSRATDRLLERSHLTAKDGVDRDSVQLDKAATSQDKDDLQGALLLLRLIPGLYNQI